MVFITWIFNIDGHRIKEEVYCEISREIRTFYKASQGFENILTETEMFAVNILKCNLFNNSGFTYNSIGSRFEDFYEFNENSSFFNHKNTKSLFEISFENGDWQVLPNGLNMITYVSSLIVTNCGLTILDRRNLFQFGENLIAVNFSSNLLTFLSSDLFDHNAYIRFCDFSDNPFFHVSNIFLNATYHSRYGINFYFHNVDCIKSNNDDGFNCINSVYVVNYGDLENNLKRELKTTELECSIIMTCLHFYKFDKKDSSKKYLAQYDFLAYHCNMDVVNPRTMVIKTREFPYMVINELWQGKCDESVTKASVEFYDQRIEFIPQMLAETIDQHKIKTLNITKSGLCSLNEYDMKQFGDDLKSAFFSYNNLKVIGKNVFKHNKKLEIVRLNGNPILYIDSSLRLHDVHEHFEKKIYRPRCRNM